MVTDAVAARALRRVQTPQGFDRATLVAAYAGARPARTPTLTDDAAVVRAAGVPVVTVAGDERAAKITVAARPRRWPSCRLAPRSEPR